MIISLSERTQKHGIMGPWKYVLAFLLQFRWRMKVIVTPTP